MSDGTIQSLSRGLSILGQFTGDSRRLGVAELSRRTGLHRTTVFRFAKALEFEGYLMFDSESGLYSVGPAWAMVLYALGSDTVFAEILGTDLQALAESSLETVVLGVRRGENVQIVRSLPSSQGFIPRPSATNIHPLNATWNVHSQILLAFCGEETRRRLVASMDRTRYTERTIVDPEAAATRLERVREEGVAYDREEFHRGACAVAVPITCRGNTLAALALIVPVERFSEDAVPTLVELLRSAADGMEKRLGTGSTFPCS